MRALLLLAVAVLAHVCGARATEALFFHNNVTGVNTWTRPAEMPYFDADSGKPYWLINGEASWTPVDKELGWVVHWSDGAVPFFVNEALNLTVWERPAVLGWSMRSSEKKFYYNTKTHETVRERPRDLGFHSEEHNATYYVDQDGDATWDAPEASAWEQHHDTEHNQPFYHNRVTGETVWEPPHDASVHWQEWFESVDEF